MNYNEERKGPTMKSWVVGIRNHLTRPIYVYKDGTGMWSVTTEYVYATKMRSEQEAMEWIKTIRRGKAIRFITPTEFTYWEESNILEMGPVA